MTLRLVTDEVLTETKAHWHTGRWRAWKLRGRPEIALLLHYITADFIVMAPAASCNRKGVIRSVQLDTKAEGNTDIVQYPGLYISR